MFLLVCLPREVFNMQDKLKRILHNTSKRKSSSSEHGEEKTHYHDESSPNASKQYTSTNDHPQSYHQDSHRSGRSQPLSSIHNDPQGDNAHLKTDHSNSIYEEDVADRNIDQYSPTSYARRQNLVEEDTATESTLPHQGVTPREDGQRKRSANPMRTVHSEHGPCLSETDTNLAQISIHKSAARQATLVRPEEQSAETRGAFAGSPHEMQSASDTSGSGQWKVQQRSLLDGVVDLNNTVDTDKVTRWAPCKLLEF